MVRGMTKKKATGPRYTRHGRSIHDRGAEIVFIERVVDGNNRSHITPHDCDRLAQHIVDLLNARPLPRRARGSAS